MKTQSDIILFVSLFESGTNIIVSWRRFFLMIDKMQVQKNRLIFVWNYVSYFLINLYFD